jgi:hypothetical protein
MLTNNGMKHGVFEQMEVYNVDRTYSVSNRSRGFSDDSNTDSFSSLGINVRNLNVLDTNTPCLHFWVQKLENSSWVLKKAINASEKVIEFEDPYLYTRLIREGVLMNCIKSSISGGGRFRLPNTRLPHSRIGWYNVWGIGRRRTNPSFKGSTANLSDEDTDPIY